MRKKSIVEFRSLVFLHECLKYTQDNNRYALSGLEMSHTTYWCSFNRYDCAFPSRFDTRQILLITFILNMKFSFEMFLKVKCQSRVSVSLIKPVKIMSCMSKARGT